MRGVVWDYRCSLKLTRVLDDDGCDDDDNYGYAVSCTVFFLYFVCMHATHMCMPPLFVVEKNNNPSVYTRTLEWCGDGFVISAIP